MGTSTWSGSALTEASQIIDEIEVMSVGWETCKTKGVSIEWFRWWVLAEDAWVIEVTDSAGLKDLCLPKSYLAMKGSHDWTGGDVHDTRVKVTPHPNVIVPPQSTSWPSS